MDSRQYIKNKKVYRKMVGGETGCPARDYVDAKCPESKKERHQLFVKIHPDKNPSCLRESTQLTQRILDCPYVGGVPENKILSKELDYQKLIEYTKIIELTDIINDQLIDDDVKEPINRLELQKLIEIKKIFVLLIGENIEYIDEPQYTNYLNYLLNMVDDTIILKDNKKFNIRSFIYMLIKYMSNFNMIVVKADENDPPNNNNLLNNNDRPNNNDLPNNNICGSDPCLNLKVDDKEIIDMMKIPHLAEIYKKIILVKTYFMSIEFADQYNDGKQLTSIDLMKYYNLRQKELTGDIYISAGPNQEKLTHKYVDRLAENIKTFILSRQYDVWDSVYHNDPYLFIEEILTLPESSQSFATLFYLEYYYKRLIQDGVTEFTLNYRVFYSNLINNYSVSRGNELYSRFILRNVNLIKKYVNDRLPDIDAINNLDIPEQLKAYFRTNKIRINITTKGGNLIKMLLDKNLQKKSDTYNLEDYNEYMTRLSDWDYEIHINIHNPVKSLDIVVNNNTCNNEYGKIYQLVKKMIVSHICQYFKDIKQLYSSNYNDYDDIETSIKCQIIMINQLFRNFHPDMQLRIAQKHIDVRFNHPVINSKDANDYIDELICDTESTRAQNIFNSAIPVATAHTNLFSYISQRFIGEANEYFDLTRLCLRLETNGCLLKAKSECIDFGIDVPYSINYNIINTYDSYYTWVIKAESFTYKGKSITYLACEVLKIALEQNSKRIKRIFRFFDLLEYAFNKNDSLFEIFNVNFKYLENKFMEMRLNLNVIDAIFYLFLILQRVIKINIAKLEKINIFIVLKNVFNNVIDTMIRNDPNEMNEKIKFKYSPIGADAFTFKSYLRLSDHINILTNYHQDVALERI